MIKCIIKYIIKCMSLNVSPEKGGERVVNCWNCDGPLTPTHQCEEVSECDSDYHDESCYYNSDSDPCGQCPPCRFKVKRHGALFREK